MMGMNEMTMDMPRIMEIMKRMYWIEVQYNGDFIQFIVLPICIIISKQYRTLPVYRKIYAIKIHEYHSNTAFELYCICPYIFFA